MWRAIRWSSIAGILNESSTKSQLAQRYRVKLTYPNENFDVSVYKSVVYGRYNYKPSAQIRSRPFTPLPVAPSDSGA